MRTITEYLRTMVPSLADPVIEKTIGTSCRSIDWMHGWTALEFGFATRLE